MSMQDTPVILRKNNKKENLLMRSLSKRKSLMGIARLGTPAKKKLKKFSRELTAKFGKAIENREIEPKERWLEPLSLWILNYDLTKHHQTA